MTLKDEFSMNLYQIRYFIQLARMEHYTKAAELLGITQPSLSHAIAVLEAELGTVLFEKQGRNVKLSKYGKVFLEYAIKSLDILDYGTNVTKSMVNPASGNVDLAFIYTLGERFIPDVISRFQSTGAYKNVTFTVNSGNSYEIIGGLKDGRFDIGFCSKEADPEIEFTPLFEQKLVLIVPEAHPLANKKSINLNETAEYPQIMFSKSSGLRPIIEDMFKSVGVAPNIIYEVEEEFTIAGFVAKNFGVAVVPSIALLNLMKVKTLDITWPPYKRYIYLANALKKYTAPVVTEFKNFVLGSFNI